MNIASLKSGDFAGLISQSRLVRSQYSHLIKVDTKEGRG